MKIALVAEEASALTRPLGSEPASQETRIVALAQELASQDHDVTSTRARTAADLPDEDKLPGRVRVEYVTAGRPSPWPTRPVLPHIQAFAVGLPTPGTGTSPTSCTRSAGPAVWPRWPGRATGVSRVQTFHSLRTAERRHHIGRDGALPAGVAPEAETGSRHRLERAVACSADAVIATSSDELQDLTSLGVRRTSVSVVPFGVDPERFGADGPVAPRGGRPG